MKIAINGVPKKDETKAIRDIIDKMLAEKFTTWKMTYEDSKGGSLA